MGCSGFLTLRVALLAGLFSVGGAHLSPLLAQSIERDHDCPPAPEQPTALGVNACILIDASESVDSLAGPLTFRWQMGDGQVREGVQFEYCYAAPGRYVVQLDVVDKITGKVRPREEERVVDFLTQPVRLPEPILRFSAPPSAKVGIQVTFEIDERELPACLPPTVQFNWNFRDGLLGQGRTVTHVFRRAGTYVVRAAINGSGITTSCLPYQCVTRAIVIEP